MQGKAGRFGALFRFQGADCRFLGQIEKGVQWWIGDWWAFGAHRYGDRAKAAAEGIFGRAFQTMADAAWVARKFETSRRREVLSFSHHAEVASLPAPQADALLDEAEAEGWSQRELRQRVVAGEGGGARQHFLDRASIVVPSLDGVAQRDISCVSISRSAWPHSRLCSALPLSRAGIVRSEPKEPIMKTGTVAPPSVARGIALAVAALAVLGACRPASAQVDSPLVGQWKILSIEQKDAQIGKLEQSHRLRPDGRVIYTKGGDFVILLFDSDRNNSIIAANIGRYKVEDNRFVSYIETSWNPAWIGTSLESTFEIQGNRMRVVTAPPKGGATGETGEVIALYERISE